MEIAPGIHRIEAPLGDRFVCMFALVGDSHILLVDTGIAGMPQQYIAPYFASLGLDVSRVRYVITTHADFDHSGGNGDIRDLASGAVFMCHQLDRHMIEDFEVMLDKRYSEFAADHGFVDSEEARNSMRASSRHIPVDIGLAGGEKIRLGKDWVVEVLHTPGHSWGHLTVYDPRSQTAIIADAALFNSVLTKDGKPAFPPTYRYVETYVGTIQRFQGMPIATLLTSHYPVYRGSEVAEFLGESRSYVDRVDDALVNALKSARKPRTLRELIVELHARLGSWPSSAEIYLNQPLYGHLERLERYGKLTLGRRDGLITFAWKG